MKWELGRGGSPWRIYSPWPSSLDWVVGSDEGKNFQRWSFLGANQFPIFLSHILQTSWQAAEISGVLRRRLCDLVETGCIGKAPIFTKLGLAQ